MHSGCSKFLDEQVNPNIEEKVKKTAVILLRQNIDLHMVAQVTGLSIEELKKIKASI